MRKISTAFSLLELLVAMAVLSILVVMMLGLVSSATALWRQSENRADAYREARAAVGIISRDLTSALAGGTNTNHFLFGNDAAKLLASDGKNVSGSNQQSIFFLAAFPINAQPSDPDQNYTNKSDVCSVGYFVAHNRTSVSPAANQAPTMNLYRYFVGSDETFHRLSDTNRPNPFQNNIHALLSVDLSSPPNVDAGGVELLARNVREFRVTPLVLTNGGGGVEYSTNFRPDTNRPLPDAVEITITAVNQESAKRFPSKADWISDTPPDGLTNQQQTFTTRIRIPAGGVR